VAHPPASFWPAERCVTHIPANRPTLIVTGRRCDHQRMDIATAITVTVGGTTLTVSVVSTTTSDDPRAAEHALTAAYRTAVDRIRAMRATGRHAEPSAPTASVTPALARPYVGNGGARGDAWATTTGGYHPPPLTSGPGSVAGAATAQHPRATG
jgi:hypothetical protein